MIPFFPNLPSFSPFFFPSLPHSLSSPLSLWITLLSSSSPLFLLFRSLPSLLLSCVRACAAQKEENRIPLLFSPSSLLFLFLSLFLFRSRARDPSRDGNNFSREKEFSSLRFLLPPFSSPSLPSLSSSLPLQLFPSPSLLHLPRGILYLTRRNFPSRGEICLLSSSLFLSPAFSPSLSFSPRLSSLFRFLLLPLSRWK